MKYLINNISKELPKNENFKIFYIQTNPTIVKSLVYEKKKKYKTLKTRHFFTLIDVNDLIIFSIEILIYIKLDDFYSIDEHIYISKCDSTGIDKKNIKIGNIVSVFLKWIINYDSKKYFKKYPNTSKLTYNEKLGVKSKKDFDENSFDELKNNYDDLFTIKTFKKIALKLKNDSNYYEEMNFYGNKKKNLTTHVSLSSISSKKRVKISLFSKKSLHYFFKNSFKNKYKHLVEGRDLLKWWIKIIDFSLDDNWTCKLLIPGSETGTTKKLIEGKTKWSVGHIFCETNNCKSLAISSIPNFPDDPKGRFLNFLVFENRHFTTTIFSFYKELSFRQEFLSSNLVGLIGCSINFIDIKDRNHEDDVFFLPISIYKKILNMYTNTSFDSDSTIKNLVQKKLPICIENYCLKKEFSYIHILGQKENFNNTLKRNNVDKIENILHARKKINYEN